MLFQIYFNIEQTWARSLLCIQQSRIQSLAKHLRWSFCENRQWPPIVNYLDILTRFWIHFCRSSHRRCSVRKDLLRNFAKFTGKHQCQKLYFNKVAGLRPEACAICEISKNTFFTERVWATASASVHLLIKTNKRKKLLHKRIWSTGKTLKQAL